MVIALSAVKTASLVITHPAKTTTTAPHRTASTRSVPIATTMFREATALIQIVLPILTAPQTPVLMALATVAQASTQATIAMDRPVLLILTVSSPLV